MGMYKTSQPLFARVSGKYLVGYISHAAQNFHGHFEGLRATSFGPNSGRNSVPDPQELYTTLLSCFHILSCKSYHAYAGKVCGVTGMIGSHRDQLDSDSFIC